MSPVDPAKARTMLVRDEGLRLKPYRCTAGRLTVGVGHNLDDLGISEAVAYQMLNEDVKAAEDGCLSLFGEKVWNSWSENRRCGWVNFVFNLGLAGAGTFQNALKAAKGGNWKEVERHLKASKWYDQVGSRAERVIAMVCRGEFPYA